jgi:frataxin
MLEKDFYHYCEQTLSKLFEGVEAFDKDCNFDTDYSDGILKIILPLGKTFVINRNSGNQKIWFSSPFSGADYFAFNEEKKAWLNDSEIELSKKLFDELKNLV